MADNVAITAGAGTTIATDDVGAGVQVQRVKVTWGVDGTATDAAAATPLPVTTGGERAEDAGHSTGHVGNFVLGVANEAGAALAGTDLDYTPFATDLRGVADFNIRQPQKWFEIDVPGVANTAHAAGDQLGTIITITNAARQSGGTGWINSIQYYDNDDVTGAFDVYFFDSTVTLAADDAAFAISDADARKLVYVANVTYVTDLGAQRYGQLAGLSIPYICVGGTSLFVALQVRVAATFTGGATGQHIRFALTRD